MLLRSGSHSDKGLTLDSGYRSDHNTTFELKSIRQVLSVSYPLRGIKDHNHDLERIDSDQTLSSEPGDDEAQFRKSSPPQLRINEQSDNKEQVEPEICETDSEDEISMEFKIPYTTSKDFPIVPLPNTLARAGYEIAAMKVEVSSTKVNGKCTTQEEVKKSSALPRNGRSKSRAAKKQASAGVLVPKQRARYSLADALKATEGLRQFSDGDGDGSEGEYV
ncbi:hypothetical protein T440DRAFT_477328 [Plenodomus tracheiphilus IPT5]|uniref:Uncharacterized protein n=1 Tax=Plenodomus tracheiphilus IPT5 TaxID=1408161 RepID=A0A6A7BCA2_9PLEO|nr:hypothetical protein T440DRAFT_477328 [Plenodomus tracheiphilus IPT5]